MHGLVEYPTKHLIEIFDTTALVGKVNVNTSSIEYRKTQLAAIITLNNYSYKLILLLPIV